VNSDSPGKTPGKPEKFSWYFFKISKNINLYIYNLKIKFTKKNQKIVKIKLAYLIILFLFFFKIFDI